MQRSKQKTQEKLKEEKGITLIALIVTIIVLLILTGITVVSLNGEEGVLDKTLATKKKVEKAQIYETIKQAAIAANMLGRGKIKEGDLKSELDSHFGTEGEGYTISEVGTDGWIVNIPDDEKMYFAATDANVDIIDNSNSLVLGLVDDLGTRSTIYLYNNKNKITEGTITVTMPDGETTNTIVAQEDTSNIVYDAEVNKYTTYTVSKNGLYTFKSSDGENETETKIVVQNIEKFTPIETLAQQQNLTYAGTAQNAYTYKGAAVPKGYYVDTKSEVDTGLVVTDQIDGEGYSTGNEWVWVPVNSTVGNDDYYLTGSGNMAGAETVGYTKYSKLWKFTTNATTGVTTRAELGETQSQPSEEIGYREPAILTGGSYGETARYSSINNRTTGTAFTNVVDVATQYRDDYDNMAESVDNYKGFYIGRYELTVDGEKPGKALTNKNWYIFYNQSLTYGTHYTESGMIYGALWDATMQWLAKSNYWVGSSGQTYSGYGNYNSEAVTVNNNHTIITVKAKSTSQKLATGQTSYTNSNNIYDLSGNCMDWTQEAYGTDGRSYRGGYYAWAMSGFNSSANRYIRNVTVGYDYSSSRSHFFIK